jgi:hypothetical protein
MQTKIKTYDILSDIGKCEMLKDELDEHIRFDNNNEGKNIKDQ